MTQPPDYINSDTFDHIKMAQANMRKAYANGALGVLASGTVWLIAAIVAFWISSQTAIWSLFFGGMLIHPFGLLLCKLVGVSGQHAKSNMLGKSAMEGTFFMLLCIPLALLLSIQNDAWFFQGMLLIIGGRYLTFATLFGKKEYWLLGGALAMAGFLLFFLKLDAALSALVGSTVELVFGTILFRQFRREQN